MLILCLTGDHAGSLGIPSDETQIATDLYAGLQKFYALHKNLQNRPLFITGESYAGKYVPALGMLLGICDIAYITFFVLVLLYPCSSQSCVLRFGKPEMSCMQAGSSSSSCVRMWCMHMLL